MPGGGVAPASMPLARADAGALFVALCVLAVCGAGRAWARVGGEKWQIAQGISLDHFVLRAITF